MSGPSKHELQERVLSLQQQIESLKVGTSNTTIEYLLTSATALVSAANVLVQMRPEDLDANPACNPRDRR